MRGAKGWRFLARGGVGEGTNPVDGAAPPLPLSNAQVLPNILHIGQLCTMVEFESHIYPYLEPIFPITEPIQILQISLHNMDILLTKSPPNKVQEHILPMIYRALDGDNVSVQQLSLSVMYATSCDAPVVQSLVTVPARSRHRANRHRPPLCFLYGNS